MAALGGSSSISWLLPMDNATKKSKNSRIEIIGLIWKLNELQRLIIGDPKKKFDDLQSKAQPFLNMDDKNLKSLQKELREKIGQTAKYLSKGSIAARTKKQLL